MIKKQTMLATFMLSALTASFMPASAGDSIWNHNGSEMLLQANGASRVITYYNPRRGISARPGQVLFEGRRVGNSYKGTAYVFRSGCRTAGYKVSGRLSSETRIVLRGAAPKRSGCRVVGYSRNSGNSRLVFTYIRAADGQYGSQQPRRPQADEPQYEGPQAGPVQTIIRSIPGGKVIFKVQDQDEPVSKPIRIDARAVCNNGRSVRIYNNHRTCELENIWVTDDESMISVVQKRYTGAGCTQQYVSTIDIVGMCE